MDKESQVSKGAPSCVGIIMDGNRRWAKKRGLPTVQGHRQGEKKLREVLTWSKELGIAHVVVYAFSTENWKRSEEEVGYLVAMFREAVAESLRRLQDEDVAIWIVGDLTRFPIDLQDAIARLHAENRPDTSRHLWVAASYGGRAEIVAAMNTLANRGGPYREEDVAGALWCAGMPDPDVIIRTGGQRRLSNFLLWHAAYSELRFLDTLWPDLTREEFIAVLTEAMASTKNHGV